MVIPTGGQGFRRFLPRDGAFNSLKNDAKSIPFFLDMHVDDGFEQVRVIACPSA